jgi:hypothetical protein
MPPIGKTLHCQLGSDGMTIDEEGNLYLTGRGVSVVDNTGKKIEQIDVQENWTGNVCFGGKDRKMLFITASKGLYAIKLRLKGANPSKQAARENMQFILVILWNISYARSCTRSETHPF